jgi:hypothetical protein
MKTFNKPKLTHVKSHKDIFAELDAKDIDVTLNFNTRQKFTVKVGELFGGKVGGAKRYDLINRPSYFYSEVEARDCFNFFRNKGAKLESEIC